MASKAFLKALRKKHGLGEFRKKSPKKRTSKPKKSRRIYKGSGEETIGFGGM